MPGCSTTCAMPRRDRPKPNCAICWDVFCLAKTMYSSASGCCRVASATATLWPACLLHPSNFLLLDEPTNHLDMRAKDVLLESLQEFTGTVVFVSHDRYFLEHLANRVFEVGEGEVRVFPGNYADYPWRKQGGHEQIPTLKDVLIGVPPAEPIAMPGASASAKRMNPMKLKQMQDQAQALEARIASTGGRCPRLRNCHSRISSSPNEAMRLSNLLESQRAELDRAMDEWEQVTEQIEATA